MPLREEVRLLVAQHPVLNRFICIVLHRFEQTGGFGNLAGEEALRGRPTVFLLPLLLLKNHLFLVIDTSQLLLT